MAKTITKVLKNVDLDGSIIPFEINIKALFCKHNYRKHYSPILKEFNQRCTKCGKEIERC